MSTESSPKFINAPGLVVRRLANGYTAFWQARSDIVAKGWSIKTRQAWQGLEPTEADRARVSDLCNALQDEMLAWSRGSKEVAAVFDGTLGGLVRCYRSDPDSSFRKLRYRSRLNYDSFLRRIVEDHGDVYIASIKARHVIRWHEDWMLRGTTMAHGLIGHLRTILKFGSTLLDDPDCRAAKAFLSDMRFPMGKRRDSILTFEQAVAVRHAAHAAGLHSIALAQAFQYDLMFRQKDIIGEWVPLSEPGTSDVLDDQHKKKWLWGIRWSEIDDDFVLRHVTSKRNKPYEAPLKLAPMIMEELASFGGVLPTHGPVIISDHNDMPWKDDTFRRKWRELADSVGIPKSVKNMDTRAGGISEATDAGVDLELVRHAATHSNITTTQGYSRSGAAKTAEVMKKRVEYRNRSGK